MTAIFLRATASDPQAGLSLIEVLVVIAILGMTAVLGSTSWQSWRAARRLDDTADRAALLIEQARTEARHSGASVSIFIDPDQGILNVPATRRSLSLPEGIGLHVVLAKLGGPLAIVMLPDGSSTGGELTFESGGFSPLRLVVSWVDGGVRHAPR